MARASLENSEWLTRKVLVDQALRGAGWRVCPFADGPLSRFDRCAVEEYPTGNGPADYALALDGRVLGVVEAKKLSLGPQNVLSQADRYSRGLDQDGFGWNGCSVPFLYSTNGEVIWYHDVRHQHNRSRPVAGFHTPEALRESLRRDDDAALSRLVALPNDAARLRPYLSDASVGTTMENLNQQLLKAMPLLLPSVKGQDEIVRRVQELNNFADRLQARYEKARAQVDRLTQSVLAKAFRGELVPTETDLARREGRSYETAEELLERIQASAAAHHGAAKSTRKATVGR